MANKYRVYVKQVFRYPVEVIAEDEDDAIDSIHKLPSHITPDHQFDHTLHDTSWTSEVIEYDVSDTENVSRQLIKPELTIPTLDYMEVKQALDDFSRQMVNVRSWSYVTGIYEAILLDMIMGYSQPTDILYRLTKVMKQLNEQLARDLLIKQGEMSTGQ